MSFKDTNLIESFVKIERTKGKPWESLGMPFTL